MRASDHFESEAEFLAALEAAEENAISSFDMGFVSDLTQKAEKYGLEVFMSEAQYETLKRIARL